MTTQAPAAAANSNPLSLPPTLSPDAIDALTDLATTLTRVRAGLLSSPGAVPDPTTNPTTSSTASTTAVTSSAPSGSGAGNTDTGTGAGAATGTLSLVDFPGATDAVKHKVQRARAQIRRLPDMARTTAEQDDELAQLGERVARQREVLAGLRDAGVRFARGAGEGEDDGSNQTQA